MIGTLELVGHMLKLLLVGIAVKRTSQEASMILAIVEIVEWYLLADH
jgi:hypothetical protein